MYRKKTPLKEQCTKNDFSILSRHTAIHLEDVSYHQIVSIDPATDNFGFRIERRHNSKSSNYNTLIETIVMTKIKFDKIKSIADNNDGKKIQGGCWNIFYDITSYLDHYKKQYEVTDLVIIERQMVDNYNAIRVSQCAIDYFLNKYPNIIVVEIDSKVKGKILGYKQFNDNCLGGIDLKKWCIIEARALLIKRNDEKGLTILDREKKQDDVADTIIQIEALFMMLGFRITNPIRKKILNK